MCFSLLLHTLYVPLSEEYRHGKQEGRHPFKILVTMMNIIEIHQPMTEALSGLKTQLLLST